MMKRYKFRKVFFVCKNNSVFSDYAFVNCFKDGEHAEEQAIYHQRKAIEDSQLLWERGKPIPQFKAHGFYLVHESLFDEILEKFNQD